MNELKIEIKEKGSEAFYTEAVNVASQYRRILKNHSCKIKDYFKQFTVLAVIAAIFLVVLVAMMIAWGVQALDIAGVVLLAFALAMCIVYLNSLNKFRRGMLTDQRTSLLTLDENGLELRKDDSQVVRIGWKNIAVVRILAQSMNFVSADQTGIVISVDKRYEGQVGEWLRANQADLEIVE